MTCEVPDGDVLVHCGDFTNTGTSLLQPSLVVSLVRSAFTGRPKRGTT
jgi:hypothetical protein